MNALGGFIFGALLAALLVALLGTSSSGLAVACVLLVGMCVATLPERTR